MNLETPGDFTSESVRPGVGFERIVVLVEDSFRGLLTVRRLSQLPIVDGAQVLLLGHPSKDSESVAHRTLEREAHRLIGRGRLSVETGIVGHDLGASLAEIGSRFEPELLLFSKQVAHGFRRFKALQRLRELYKRTTLFQVSDRETRPYRYPLVALSEEPDVRALALASRICGDVPLKALHVRDSSGFSGVLREAGASADRMRALEKRLVEEARSELEAALARAPGVQRPELEVGVGDPVEVLLEEVERRDVDLLIGGPRRGPGRAKLGVPDTLERLLLDVPCDMAVAPRE